MSTSPEMFIGGVTDDRRRRDGELLLQLMSRATGEQPVMWGSSMVGFGRYHYVYDSGREGDAMAVGFSPRKAATVVYLMDGFEERTELLERLGPHKVGKACLYLKQVDGAVDLAALEELVRRSYETTSRATPRD